MFNLRRNPCLFKILATKFCLLEKRLNLNVIICMFPDRPKLIFQNDKDEPPFDCDETTTVNALFDLMNLNQNTELTDALIVSSENYFRPFMN